MTIDPVLKMFWILVAAILGTNAAWFFYVSHIEDEIANIYKSLKLQHPKLSKKKKFEIKEVKSRNANQSKTL